MLHSLFSIVTDIYGSIILLKSSLIVIFKSLDYCPIKPLMHIFKHVYKQLLSCNIISFFFGLRMGFDVIIILWLTQKLIIFVTYFTFFPNSLDFLPKYVNFSQAEYFFLIKSLVFIYWIICELINLFLGSLYFKD